MDAKTRKNIQEIFPRTLKHMGRGVWEAAVSRWPDPVGPKNVPDIVAAHMDETAFLPDLARLEWAVRCVTQNEASLLPETDGISLNRSLTVLDLSWKHLPLLLQGEAAPDKGNEFVLIYRHPNTKDVVIESASDEDLLALKLVADDVSPRAAAASENVSPSLLETALRRAVKKGILLRKPSKIKREWADFESAPETSDSFLSASVFTLQWHVTQVCDLHCKHCYDRTDRHSLELPTALGILDDFYDFCRNRNVGGHVSFTGGNPLLYPDFTALYRAAADLGFSLAILGNPTSRKRMEELKAIDPPAFYQVSLEGLAEHNDRVRGPGHFERVVAFLEILKSLDIYAMVMLTLTRDNMGQVLPLAEFLRDKTDLFTFNRLSMVGEGANLRLPPKAAYASFLKDYLEAAKDNPTLSLKDNLLNIILKNRGDELFGGCAGFGCGAAFNFLSVLPDGEAHACRKFPSPVGNVLKDGIAGVYDSQEARQYRLGPRACRSCAIRPVCGGCLAVAHSFGLNIFEERDPFCFMTESPS
jgi:selenobiotic family peptide radical SAM maturase